MRRFSTAVFGNSEDNNRGGVRSSGPHRLCGSSSIEAVVEDDSPLPAIFDLGGVGAQQACRRGRHRSDISIAAAAFPKPVKHRHSRAMRKMGDEIDQAAW